MKNSLKNRRLDLGLTLEEVANIVGVEKSTISKWENGKIANMRRDKILLYAKALQTSTDFILDAEDDNNALGKVLNYDEKFIIVTYRELNNEAKTKIKEYVHDLKASDKYSTVQKNHA